MRPDFPDLSVDTGGYDPLRSYWMMLLSWSLYFTGERLLERSRLLEEAGLCERVFLSVGGIDCAILTPAGRGTSWMVLVFQGTAEIRQWLYNVDVMPRKWAGEGLVHSGFAKALDRVWPHLKVRMREAGGPLFFTGHSLGGALANLAAARWEGEGTAYLFGAPRVGNADFGHSCEDLELWRVVLGADVVPGLPATLPGTPERLRYRPAGEEVLLCPEEQNPDARPSTRAEFDQALKEGRPPRSLTHHAPVNYLRALGEAL